MTNRALRVGLVVLGAAVAAGGCGVDKKQHAAVVKEKQKLARELEEVKEENTEARRSVATIHHNFEKMKARTEEAEKRAKQARAVAAAMKKNFGAKLKATAKEMDALTRARMEADRSAKLVKSLREQLQKLVDEGRLSLKTVHGRMVIKLRSKVLFLSGSAKLLPYGKRTLGRIAKVLRAIEGNHFQVAGHTDDKPMKSKTYASNWALSTARALEVVKLLQARGVPGKMLSAAGFGEFQPVASNRYAWGRQMNRRIEITLLPYIPRQLVKKPPKKRGRRKK